MQIEDGCWGVMDSVIKARNEGRDARVLCGTGGPTCIQKYLPSPPHVAGTRAQCNESRCNDEKTKRAMWCGYLKR